MKGGDVIALTGDLGAGKTLMTQGIARGLGLSSDQVNSPTFSLIQVYKGPLPIVHVDLYRLESPEAIHQLGLEDYFNEENVVIVEWADRFPQVLMPDYLEVHLEHGETETTRTLTMRATGTRSQALASALRIEIE